MSSHLPPYFSRPFLKFFSYLEAILLISISFATLFSIFEEFMLIYKSKTVRITDILLLFIYLEVLAMVQQFVVNGKIPVRYPIYIAMMAIARYITLGLKELDVVSITWLALASFILAATTILMRVGHHYWPYYNKTTQSLVGNDVTTKK